MTQCFFKVKQLNVKIKDKDILKNISLSFKHGEICSIFGENGSGKSMLMKTISGIQSYNSGEIYFDGEQVNINQPTVAHTLGIYMVQQEHQLVESLTVAENVFLNRQHKSKWLKLIDYKSMYRASRDVLDKLGIDIDPEMVVEKLSYWEKQLIEIAKAISNEAKVIILDEPMRSLPPEKVATLLNLLVILKNKGVLVLLVSHKIEETMTVTDRVIILKAGEVVSDKAAVNTEEVERLMGEMVGQDYLNRYPKITAVKNRVVLEVKYLTDKKSLIKGLSFKLRESEILGIAGINGMSKTSMLNAMLGLESKQSGRIILNNEDVNYKKSNGAIKSGFAYLDEDISNNLNFNKDCLYNITLANMPNIKKNMVLNFDRAEAYASDYMKKLNIQPSSTKELLGKFSSGNLQKIAIAKWLFSEATIYIMDNLTKGIDTAARVEVYNIMNRMIEKGSSILLLSTDNHELVGMCDRVLVFYDGKIAKELMGKQITSKNILHYSTIKPKVSE